MVFVDTNVFVYAVGRAHPLRDPARRSLEEHAAGHVPMATSAEVLQELLHIYLPPGRIQTLDAALQLASDLAVVWPVDASDVLAARDLLARHVGLSARDLLHLAICQRYHVTELLTFDRGLAAAFGRRS